MPALGVNATWGATDWSSYILDHLREQSVLLRAGVRVVPVAHKSRVIPRLLTDGTAVWVAEATEIPSDAPTGDTITLTPQKLANVVSLSNEAVDDAAADELNAVGAALTLAVASAIDTAAFSAAAATATVPAGLLNATLPAQTGGTVTVDPYLTAIGKIEANGGTASAIVVNATDLGALRLLKEATGSARPLLQPDPTQGNALTIGGVRLFPTSKIAVGKALVMQAGQVVVGIRRNTEVQFSAHAKFTADSVVARVVCRATWAWNDVKGAVLVGP